MFAHTGEPGWVLTAQIKPWEIILVLGLKVIVDKTVLLSYSAQAHCHKSFQFGCVCSRVFVYVLGQIEGCIAHSDDTLIQESEINKLLIFG